MPPPASDRTRPVAAPSFALIGRQPLRPEIILLAIALAFAAIYSLRFALEHARHARLAAESSRSSSAATPSSAKDDDDDDPNRVDTIVLGNPSEAPRPGHAQPPEGSGRVHPFIIVHLPRSGDDTGKIPVSPAGQLLYDWLAAFNHSSSSGLAEALPEAASATAAQMDLRRETGGFTLLSAKEVQPGVLVFRLHDQTPSFTEVLGTLQVVPGSSPPRIATFSLRAVDPPNKIPAAKGESAP